MACRENLIPINTLPEDKQREIRSAGGRASAKKRSERRTAREIGRDLLGLPVERGKFKKADELKALADLRDANVSAVTAIIVKLIQKAMQGDIRAARLLFELLGETQHNLNVSGEIATNYDLSRLTTEELVRFAELAAKSSTEP